MTIAEVREKCKTGFARIPKQILAILLLIAACLATFGLGYLAGVEGGTGAQMTVTLTPPVTRATSSAEIWTEGEVVASKNGTHYYPSDCPSAARISSGNKIVFASAASAERAGYSESSDCLHK